MVHVQQILTIRYNSTLIVTLTSISYGVRKRHGRRLGRASFPITPPPHPISSVKKLKSGKASEARHILELGGRERGERKPQEEERKEGDRGVPGGGEEARRDQPADVRGGAKEET